MRKTLLYLPPANEVWGKVICLHLCHSVHGGCLVPGGLVLGGSRPGVMPGPGGVPGPRGCPGGETPQTATVAGGTHPTGMHSSFRRFFRDIKLFFDSTTNIL